MNEVTKAPISVIIPCYCCADTIERSFASIVAQTLSPMEVIFIDDCSKDKGKTLEKLYGLRDHYASLVKILVLEMEVNKGPGSSRNLGWSLATQPYIAFLDADDSWHPKKLEIQYGWMQAHPDVFISGHLSVKLKDRASYPVLNMVTASRITIKQLLLTNLLPTRSVMLKRAIQERFYPGKRQGEDYLLWLQIAFSGLPIYRINLPLAFSYKEDFGTSGLNGNLSDSIAGVVDVYKRLQQAGYLSYWQYLFYKAIANLKHLRRKSLVMLRNHT